MSDLTVRLGCAGNIAIVIMLAVIVSCGCGKSNDVEQEWIETDPRLRLSSKSAEERRDEIQKEIEKKWEEEDNYLGSGLSKEQWNDLEHQAVKQELAQFQEETGNENR